MQFIVLGMHRSGTSVVAGLLNLMGAYFAPDEVALPPDMTNPKGYWERKDVIIANKKLMESMGATWHQISQWDMQQVTEQQRQGFQQQVEPIMANLNQYSNWLLKDPRLCLTLPLWQPYFEQPIYIIVYRSPIQIAQSLHKRNQFSLHTGLALWERHMLDGLRITQNQPQVLVSFHDLVQNPLETTQQLYQDMAQYGSNLNMPSDAEIIDFVQPNYMHQRGNKHLLKAFANHQQLELVQQFEQDIIFRRVLPELSEGAQATLAQHDAHYQQQRQMQLMMEEKERFQYWLDSLSGDIQAMFQSQTWKWGERLTDVILKLLGRKKGQTAKDNALRMIAEYQDWKRLQ